jgi:hypothetical protein
LDGFTAKAAEHRLRCTDFVPATASGKYSELKRRSAVVRRAVNEDETMKSSLILLAAAGIALTASVASAEETRIGVGVGPVGAGVTVGQSPRHEERTTIIKEREPRRDDAVVIRKERHDEPREKVIIKDRD